MTTKCCDTFQESRWLTYLKAVLFTAPAVAAWGFACVFLVPKAVEIAHMSGLETSKFGWSWPTTFFFVHWGRTLLVTMLIALALMEFARPRWWHRRVALGVSVWLTNAIVFFGLITLLIVVLMAAPSLASA